MGDIHLVRIGYTKIQDPKKSIIEQNSDTSRSDLAVGRKAGGNERV